MTGPAAPSRETVLPYGRAAVLVEVAHPGAVADLHAALRARPAVGVAELIPAARTVLIRFDPSLTSAQRVADEARALLRRLADGRGLAEGGSGAVPDADTAHSGIAHSGIAHSGAADAGTPSDPVLIDVSYDGADLSALSRELGLCEQEIVARHTGATYRCAFCGFAPGFSYLVGLDPALHVRRLAEPRVRVPAGSVAIAGEFSAVYPAASPGGWRLLGRTDAPMWDARRPDPALAPPGALVRFRPIRATVRGSWAR